MKPGTEEPPYYAKDGKVWKRPVHTPQPNGGTSISIGFPICAMLDIASADAAATVAELMNRGDQFDRISGKLETARDLLVRDHGAIVAAIDFLDAERAELDGPQERAARVRELRTIADGLHALLIPRTTAKGGSNG